VAARNQFPLKIAGKGDKVTTPSFNGVIQATISFGLADATALAKLPDSKKTATASDDNARMWFFARNKGATDWGVAYAEVEGFLSKKSGKPFWDSHGNMFVKAPILTDFQINLVWTESDFTGVNAAYLKLPWIVDLTNPTMELSVQIMLNNDPVTPVGEAVIDILLQHTNVNNGETAAKRLTFIGARTLYPLECGVVMDNSWVPFPSSVPFDKTNGKFNVYLHETVRSGVEALVTGGFEFDKISAAIKEIISGVGFTNVNVQEVKDNDALITNSWVTSSTPVKAKNVVDPNNFHDNEGTDIPFFDFFIFFSTAVNPNGTEIAHSEALNGTKVKNMGATKPVISGMTIVGKNGAPFQLNFAQATNKAAYIAVVICHEIGHAFGIQHPVHFNGTKYTVDDAAGTMSGMLYPPDPAFPMPFGPVHTAMLKKMCGL
jgi:hypothetical protein